MDNQNSLTKTSLTQPLTPEQFILNHELKAISTIAIEQGSDVALQVVLPIAGAYLNLIEVGGKMSAPAVVLMCQEMITDFPDWKVEDFKYFFKGFAKGNFNEKIFRVDMAVVYEGAKNYEKERTSAREKAIAKQKSDYVKLEKKIQNQCDPEITNELQKLLDNLGKKKVIDEKPREIPPYEAYGKLYLKRQQKYLGDLGSSAERMVKRDKFLKTYPYDIWLRRVIKLGINYGNYTLP